MNKYFKLLQFYLGFKLIDPIEVFYLPEEKTFYPIVSKSGCSSVKQILIKKYNPNFSSSFEEIHFLSPEDLTNNRVKRVFFYTKKKYLEFSKGKKICMVIRDPYKRFYSCYLDIIKEKNIMYEWPSGLHEHFKFTKNINFDNFLSLVCNTNDNLSDRHFRSQSFYFSNKVKSNVSNFQISILEDFMLKMNEYDSEPTKLNSNNKSIPNDKLEFLQRHSGYNKRFSEDINLYNSIK